MFSKNEDAEKALSLDGTKIKDEEIKVYIKVSPPKPSRDSQRNSQRGSRTKGPPKGSKRDVTFNISLGSPPRETGSRYKYDYYNFLFSAFFLTFFYFSKRC